MGLARSKIIFYSLVCCAVMNRRTTIQDVPPPVRPLSQEAQNTWRNIQRLIWHPDFEPFLKKEVPGFIETVVYAKDESFVLEIRTTSPIEEVLQLPECQFLKNKPYAVKTVDPNKWRFL